MIRVYRYGLLAPTENGEIVRDEMLMAHRYRNTLVEIERGKRSAIRAVLSQAGDIPTLEAACSHAEEEHRRAFEVVMRARAKTRSRSETPEMKSNEKAARARRSEAKRALADARKAIRKTPSLVEAQAAIYDRSSELVRSARAHCGLGEKGPHFGAWGTYLLVEAAGEQAAKSLPLYRGADANDPSFVRFADVHRQRVGVQIQGGMSIAEAFSQEDTRLRIGGVDDRAWYDRSGGEARARGQGKRASMRTTIRLRIGSAGRAPIWGTWPMVMHRAIPEGAVIKSVAITVEKIGPREAWYACITVDESNVERRPTCGTGRVAVPVGWRVRPGRDLRVAVLLGDHDGDAPTEVMLDAEWNAALDKADALRETRDKGFNVARDALAAWLKDRAGLPAFLDHVRPHLWQWRSAGKLSALALRWRNERFAGDEDAYVALESWRYKDHHLWEWEASQRKKTLLRRREQYRRLAAQLSREYGEVLLADVDKTQLARRPDATEKYENETARSNRFRAAVSELEEALRNAFVRAGGRVTKVDVSGSAQEGGSGVGATHECHVCGYPNDFDAALQVEQTCMGCGSIWDQDVNMRASC
jgi:hypothetical protein